MQTLARRFEAVVIAVASTAISLEPREIMRFLPICLPNWFVLPICLVSTPQLSTTAPREAFYLCLPLHVFQIMVDHVQAGARALLLEAGNT